MLQVIFSRSIEVTIHSGLHNVALAPEKNLSGATKRWHNVGLMLVHRRRRWPNIKPTLA